jgi:hypothetical protein
MRRSLGKRDTIVSRFTAGRRCPKGIAVLHPLCFLDRLGMQNLGGLYEDMSEGECDALINGFFSAAGNAMRLNPN